VAVWQRSSPTINPHIFSVRPILSRARAYQLFTFWLSFHMADLLSRRGLIPSILQVLATWHNYRQPQLVRSIKQQGKIKMNKMKKYSNWSAMSAAVLTVAGLAALAFLLSSPFP
jgi:hypothetical protein